MEASFVISNGMRGRVPLRLTQKEFTKLKHNCLAKNESTIGCALCKPNRSEAIPCV